MKKSIVKILRSIIVHLVKSVIMTLIGSILLLYLWHVGDTHLSFIAGKELLVSSGLLFVIFIMIVMILTIYTLEEKIKNEKYNFFFFCTSILLALYISFHLFTHSREYFGEDIVHINDITCTIQITDNDKIINCGNGYVYFFSTHLSNIYESYNTYNNHKGSTI